MGRSLIQVSFASQIQNPTVCKFPTQHQPIILPTLRPEQLHLNRSHNRVVVLRWPCPSYPPARVSSIAFNIATTSHPCSNRDTVRLLHQNQVNCPDSCLSVSYPSYSHSRLALHVHHTSYNQSIRKARHKHDTVADPGSRRPLPPFRPAKLRDGIRRPYNISRVTAPWCTRCLLAVSYHMRLHIMSLVLWYRGG